MSEEMTEQRILPEKINDFRDYLLGRLLDRLISRYRLRISQISWSFRVGYHIKVIQSYDSTQWVSRRRYLTASPQDQGSVHHVYSVREPTIPLGE